MRPHTNVYAKILNIEIQAYVPARVLMILSNGSAEETLAAIAGRGTVVLPRGAIAAYGACL